MRVLSLRCAMAILAFLGGQAAHAQDVKKPAQAPAQQVTVTPSAMVPKEWADVAVRLTGIEKAVEKKDSSAIWTVLITAIAGLTGVIVGGFINAWIQNKALANTKRIADEAATNARALSDSKAMQDREIAEGRAKLEMGSSLLQLELEQMSELYGPLHALFGQSNALYRQMNEVLCELEPKRFRFETGADFDKREFQILLHGEWVRFRTVMHIGEVYGGSFGIEDYFDEIVAIGKRIQKIIAEKAGFARADQPDLLLVFGRYLAHYAILRRLHSEVKSRVDSGNRVDGTTSVPMKVQESAVFPIEIQELVRRGFEAISKDLMDWRKKAAWPMTAA